MDHKEKLEHLYINACSISEKSALCLKMWSWCHKWDGYAWQNFSMSVSEFNVLQDKNGPIYDNMKNA